MQRRGAFERRVRAAVVAVDLLNEFKAFFSLMPSSIDAFLEHERKSARDHAGECARARAPQSRAALRARARARRVRRVFAPPRDGARCAVASLKTPPPPFFKHAHHDPSFCKVCRPCPTTPAHPTCLHPVSSSTHHHQCSSSSSPLRVHYRERYFSFSLLFTFFFLFSFCWRMVWMGDQRSLRQ